MDNQDYMITCPRCRNEFKSTARYCMRCGYLNPNHPSNQQYLENYSNPQNEVEEYTVSSDSSDYLNPKIPTPSKGLNIAFSKDIGSFTLCFLFNLFCYLMMVVSATIYFYKSSSDVYAMLGSELSVFLLVFSIWSLIQYSSQIIYMKMNKKWYYAFIPFVNLYMFSDALMHKKLLNLLVFVPVVGQIYILYLLYQMGKAFKKSGLLTMLFPFVVFPIIAFGGSAFNGTCYISEKDSLEKEYSKKKSFWIMNSIVIVVSLVMLLYSNAVHINKETNRWGSFYLYFASQRFVKKTDRVMKEHLYECPGESTTMYFYFPDLGDRIFLPFYMFRDPIEAYVKVVVTPGIEGEDDQYEYYLSMTDSKYGYAETAAKDIKMTTISEYPTLDPVYQQGNQCNFKRNA